MDTELSLLRDYLHRVTQYLGYPQEEKQKAFQEGKVEELMEILQACLSSLVEELERQEHKNLRKMRKKRKEIRHEP